MVKNFTDTVIASISQDEVLLPKRSPYMSASLPKEALTTWSQLLAELDLSHLTDHLTEDRLSLKDALSEAATDRVSFLTRLKTLKVGNLAERQKLANACSRAHRLDRWSPHGELSGKREPVAVERLWALSDVHTERAENMQWVLSLGHNKEYLNDTLILAGDVSDDPTIVHTTLSSLVSTFKTVFFVPGNHDLWVRTTQNGADAPEQTSLDVLASLMVVCHALGVKTAPAYAAGAIIVPILSWHHKSWDTEPDLTCWDGFAQADDCIMDYRRCKWPDHLDPYCNNDSIARHFDQMNDRPNGHGLEAVVQRLRRLHPGAPLVSFSHFVPRIELNPEKRYLITPALAKAIGSAHLRARIEALRPDCHVFGHTHFGWDITLGKVRYIQAALGYPQEREIRLSTVATGDDFPHGTDPTPVLVFTCRGSRRNAHKNDEDVQASEPKATLDVSDAASGPADEGAADGAGNGKSEGETEGKGADKDADTSSAGRAEAAGGVFAPQHVAGWSRFYELYPRRPELTYLVPPYVAARLTQLEGGMVGWGDHVECAAWELGPPTALAIGGHVPRDAKQVSPRRSGGDRATSAQLAPLPIAHFVMSFCGAGLAGLSIGFQFRWRGALYVWLIRPLDLSRERGCARRDRRRSEGAAERAQADVANGARDRRSDAEVGGGRRHSCCHGGMQHCGGGPARRCRRGDPCCAESFYARVELSGGQDRASTRAAAAAGGEVLGAINASR